MDGAALRQPLVPPDSTADHRGIVYSADARVQRELRTTVAQQNDSLQQAARAFNWWGGPGVVWCAAVLWIGARAARRRPLALVGLRGVQAIAVSSALSGIAKGLAGRSRPFLTPGEPWHWDFAHGWTDARYFSMPSGHTTATFAFAAAISVAWFGARRSTRVVASGLLFVAAFGVAYARLFLDQHWLSDVIVGSTLGTLSGWAIARWHAAHPDSALDRVLLGKRPVA